MAEILVRWVAMFLLYKHKKLEQKDHKGDKAACKAVSEVSQLGGF